MEATNSQKRLRAVTAHVVYFDRVGFSQLTIERQFALTEEINEFIRGLPDFKEALADDQVIALDTGDGHALIFLGDPQQAGNVGLAIAEHSARQRDHKIRVGLNSGPITIRTDLMGKPNATGPGIDLAARIQSLAESDTLYMTKAAAEQLIAFDAWRSRLVDMGTRLVKHEQSVHVYAAGPVGRPLGSSATPVVRSVALSDFPLSEAASSVLLRLFTGPWLYVAAVVIALVIALPLLGEAQGLGPNLLTARSSQWIDAQAEAFLEIDGGTRTWRVLKTGPTPWGVQMFWLLPAPGPGTKMRIQFESHGAAGMEVVVRLQRTVAPYDAFGLDQKIALRPEWQKHEYEFVTNASTSECALMFWCSSVPGTMSIRSIALQKMEPLRTTDARPQPVSNGPEASTSALGRKLMAAIGQSRARLIEVFGAPRHTRHLDPQTEELLFEAEGLDRFLIYGSSSDSVGVMLEGARKGILTEDQLFEAWGLDKSMWVCSDRTSANKIGDDGIELMAGQRQCTYRDFVFIFFTAGGNMHCHLFKSKTQRKRLGLASSKGGLD